jgi:hypothetical protein
MIVAHGACLRIGNTTPAVLATITDIQSTVIQITVLGSRYLRFFVPFNLEVSLLMGGPCLMSSRLASWNAQSLQRLVYIFLGVDVVLMGAAECSVILSVKPCIHMCEHCIATI